MFTVLELFQESAVVLIEKTHIIDLIFQKCDTLQTYTKGKSCILIRIDPAHTENIRMNHTTAKDFDPAGTFTETAAFSAAFEAGNINLSARLCEREMMRTEFGLCLRSEQLFCKLLKGSLKICKRNILINNKALDLMEGR